MVKSKRRIVAIPAVKKTANSLKASIGDLLIAKGKSDRLTIRSPLTGQYLTTGNLIQTQIGLVPEPDPNAASYVAMLREIMMSGDTPDFLMSLMQSYSQSEHMIFVWVVKAKIRCQIAWCDRSATFECHVDGPTCETHAFICCTRNNQPW